MPTSDEWVSFPGYSHYFISNKGQVKRIVKLKRKNRMAFKEVFLKSRIVNGYLAFTLVGDNGKKKTVYLHKAIAQSFVSKPRSDKKLIVVHKDGNKLNNTINNLIWKSYSDFMKSQFEEGRRSNKQLWDKRIKKYGPMGGKNPPGKRVEISFEKRENIYKLYNEKGFTLKVLAEKYNCSITHIFNLLRRYENANLEKKK